MFCTGSWQVDRTEIFAASTARFFNRLEAEGCLLEGRETGRAAYQVWIPGLDRLLIGLDGFSGDVTQNEVLRRVFMTIRHILWDRAEFKMDRENSELQCQWIYWGPFQMFAHTVIFLVSVSAISAALAVSRQDVLGLILLLFLLILANLIPLGLSIREGGRMRRTLVASGFHPII
jgi:hypothetical protein